MRHIIVCKYLEIPGSQVEHNEILILLNISAPTTVSETQNVVSMKDIFASRVEARAKGIVTHGGLASNDKSSMTTKKKMKGIATVQAGLNAHHTNVR